MSHDLRTPLTALRLLAEAVEDEIVDEATRRRYLERMRTHLEALGGLIDDLFELSRLEAGDINWSLERVRLDELVGETVEAMRVTADAKRVSVVARSRRRLRRPRQIRRSSSASSSTSSRTRSVTPPRTAAS